MMQHDIQRFLRCSVYVIALLLVLPAQCQSLIRVGGYPFSPFVSKDHDNYSGITLDLIEALNKSQQNYRFEFVCVIALA